MQRIALGVSFIFLFAFVVASPGWAAQQGQDQPAGQRARAEPGEVKKEPGDDAKNEDKKEPAEKKNEDEPLKKLGFGAGLGFRWNIAGGDIIADAEVDTNGVVRVKKRANTHAGITFETHYLFKRFKNDTFGLGPFVAAEAGSDAIITSVGLGVMVAWKVDENGRGFGLGLGYSAQPNVKVVGDEFVPGQKAPVGPDGKSLPVRFQEKDEGSLLVILSVVF